MARRIVIVDDHALFREALKALFATRSDFTIVAEVVDSKAAFGEVLRQAPDIVLMDIALSQVNGLALAEALKRRLPKLCIVVLTASATEGWLREALSVGVNGCLLKDASYEELVLALRSVIDGKTYLSPSVSGQLVNDFLHPGRDQRPGSALGLLTQRERRILQLVAEGLSNRAAAEQLTVSTKTVEKHRANVMRKLGLRNFGELMMVAVEMGIVERPGSVSRLVPSRAV